MKMTTRVVAAVLLAHAATFAFAQSLGWRQLPGAANDIGVGPNGEVWVIGTDRGGNDYGIHKLNADGQGWTKVPGGAVRIDVGPSGPWVVNSSGGIYRYNGRGGWDQMPGGATDIGIGANGAVWVIGGNREVGGYDIYRFNGRAWDKVAGSAVRIDVDPQGHAWVVTSGNAIYRFNGIQFVQVKGTARDISIGGNGAVYIVGTDGGVYRWGGTDWVKHDGVLGNISVDGQGRAWGVNPGKQIFSASASHAATQAPPRMIPPAPARTYNGVTVINQSSHYAWMTIYKSAKASPYGRTDIMASGCLLPGQEYTWDVMGKIDGSDWAYVITRVEQTTTEDCAPMAGNAHVRCDVRTGFYDPQQVRYSSYKVTDSPTGSKPCSVYLN